MRRKRFKKALALLLIVLILTPSSFAMGGGFKEEVIYAKLDYEGQPKALFAVNGFTKGFSGYDYGSYRKVANLSTSQDLDYDGKRVKIDAKDNFYYQGNLENEELPWLINMEWKLDGKKVNEEELLGASGHLELLFEINKNPKVESNYFDYYVVQSSFEFDVDQVSNLKAPEGTLAAAGSTKMVNFMSLPGKGGSYNLEVDIKDYEPGMVQIAALPLNLGINLDEFSDYTEDLKTLELAIAELNDGTQAFLDGLFQIKEGSQSFGYGGSSLTSGSGKLSGGLLELADGSQEFASGLGQYSEGMKEFSDGILELTSGIDELSEGLDLLSDGAIELDAGAYELASGLELLVINGKGGLDGEIVEEDNLVSASENFLIFFELVGELGKIDFDEEDLEMVEKALAFISERIIPLITSIDQESLQEISAIIEKNLVDIRVSISEISRVRDSLYSPQAYPSYEEDDLDLVADVSGHYEAQMSTAAQVLDNELLRLERIETGLSLESKLIDFFLSSLPSFEEEFLAFQDQLRELKRILEDLELNMSDIQELLENMRLLSSGYKKFHEGLVLYVDGVEEVYVGVARGQGLSYGIGALSQGLVEISKGMDQFSQVKGELESGVKELSSGTELLYTSYLELNKGLKELGQGLKDFDYGLGQYVHGFWSLHQGLETLYNGGLELGRGTSLMREETKDIDKKMLEGIEEELEGLFADEVEFQSFTSPKNDKTSSVQFIFLYEGRSLVQEEVDNGPEIEKTILDRFMDLFKKKDN